MIARFQVEAPFLHLIIIIIILLFFVSATLLGWFSYPNLLIYPVFAEILCSRLISILGISQIFFLPVLGTVDRGQRRRVLHWSRPFYVDVYAQFVFLILRWLIVAEHSECCRLSTAACSARTSLTLCGFRVVKNIGATSPRRFTNSPTSCEFQHACSSLDSVESCVLGLI